MWLEAAALLLDHCRISRDTDVWLEQQQRGKALGAPVVAQELLFPRGLRSSLISLLNTKKILLPFPGGIQSGHSASPLVSSPACFG